ncbi:putative ribonuclease H-like domain-containing protein [Lupinus albus]|uniref:Putative ribonuclease H-like domain-containing protein n=1 Tax=Lupinus albus TaxID=3870 RepID=A0A6A4Q2G2_LUPAL|nr:putative ribonuclease H-like domain-containing protein [Lupinus albus]
MPIEIAHQKGWENIWLECDSALVVDVFKGNSMVPWRLANNWHRCLAQISPMCFKVSHIFREGNSCADKLASFGVSSKVYTW